ncbi:MAG: hypothetical protein JNM39_16615 [Bdellovibrionaceae bacterium]|nr:hypothetical protein [Pseudobdellovibrionaceae bacterium]
MSTLLKADFHGLAAYSEMISSKEFMSPIPWTEIDVENFDGIVLYGRKTTALLRSQELTAWVLTCLWLKSYYRTNSETVQSGITRSLANPSDFVSGPLAILRGSLDHLHLGFVLLNTEGEYACPRLLQT